MSLERKKGKITMFELLGNETNHEAAVKRTINLQKQIMENLEKICNCYLEIKSLEEENESLSRSLEHWKGELKDYYSSLPNNLEADLSETQKEKADN